MRRFIWILACVSLMASAPIASAAADKIIKVLPEYLDKDGLNTLSPSLYDRDAYQAVLRRAFSQRSAIVFFVQWKAKHAANRNLTMRVEMRGVSGNVPHSETIEAPVKKHGWFSTWSKLTLSGEDYKKFGDLAAWRVTFWEGQTLLAEQKSFLW